MDYIDELWPSWPMKTRDSGMQKLPWVNVDCKGYKEPPPPPPPPPPPEMDADALAAAEEAKAAEKQKEKKRRGRASTILGGADLADEELITDPGGLSGT